MRNETIKLIQNIIKKADTLCDEVLISNLPSSSHAIEAADELKDLITGFAFGDFAESNPEGSEGARDGRSAESRC